MDCIGESALDKRKKGIKKETRAEDIWKALELEIGRQEDTFSVATVHEEVLSAMQCKLYSVCGLQTGRLSISNISYVP